MNHVFNNLQEKLISSEIKSTAFPICYLKDLQQI